MSNAIFPAAPGALLICALLFCATARSAEPAPTPESRALFNAGVSFLDQGRFADAYRKFKEAYAITPRWTALGNLGIAAERLERNGEAIDVMVEYLERGGSEISAKEARKVRSAIDRLRKESASVKLEAPGTFWIVDTRIDAVASVVNEYGPFEGRAQLRVRGGEHEFKLDRTSVAAAAWRATLLAGDVAAHTFENNPEPDLVGESRAEPNSEPPGDPIDAPERPSRTISYVLWGTGAVAGVAATVFFVVASRTQSKANSDFLELCPTGPSDVPGCENTTAGDAKAANWRTASLVTGIGAAVSLVAGTIVYLNDGSSAPANEEASIQPWVSPSGVGISGIF